MFIIIVFRLGCDRASGLLFFIPTFASFHTHPLLLPSSVSISYFILAVPMHQCSGKHSCKSSTFPIAVLNDTCFFHSTVPLQVHNVYSEQKK